MPNYYSEYTTRASGADVPVLKRFNIGSSTGKVGTGEEFPPMGKEQPAHLGSQSGVPSKEDF